MQEREVELGNGKLVISFSGNLFSLTATEREFLDGVLRMFEERQEALDLVDPA